MCFYSSSFRNPRLLRLLINLTSSSPIGFHISSDMANIYIESPDATANLRPSWDHLILFTALLLFLRGIMPLAFSDDNDSDRLATEMPSDPVMGSSNEDAKFHNPIVPLLEAVAKIEG